jgi:hypothetical protein
MPLPGSWASCFRRVSFVAVAPIRSRVLTGELGVTLHVDGSFQASRDALLSARPHSQARRGEADEPLMKMSGSLTGDVKLSSFGSAEIPTHFCVDEVRLFCWLVIEDLAVEQMLRQQGETLTETCDCSAHWRSTVYCKCNNLPRWAGNPKIWFSALLRYLRG